MKRLSCMSVALVATVAASLENVADQPDTTGHSPQRRNAAVPRATSGS